MRSVTNPLWMHWGFDKSVYDMILKLEGLQVLRLSSRWTRRRTRKLHLPYARIPQHTGRKDDLVLSAAYLARFHPTLSIMYHLETHDFQVEEVDLYSTIGIVSQSFTMSDEDVGDGLQHVFHERREDHDFLSQGWYLVDHISSIDYMTLSSKKNDSFVGLAPSIAVFRMLTVI